MYYVLKADSGENYENIIVSGILYNHKNEIVDDIFDAGNSLVELYESEKFTIIVDEKESTQGGWADTVRVFVTNAGNIFIASDKACSLFRELGLRNLEYFDVTIKTSKDVLSNYKIINVSGKIDCIDDEKSNLQTREDGTIRRIKNLHFKEDLIPDGLKIFLLGRKLVAKIIVHEDVKNAIEESLTGFNLTHINDYKGR